MRAIALLFVSLLASCAGPTYTYVDRVRSGEVVDRPLYAVTVPALSVFSAYPGKDVQWERYSRDGVPNDLILKEGYPHSSYAATVQVKDRLTNLRNIENLKMYVGSELKRPNPVESKRAQPNLLCVQPAVHIDRAGDNPAFFMHTMHCIDTTSGHYYELSVSLMTRRRDWFPARDLEQGARYFFDSFRLK
jgi:hypothetical protein